MDIEKFILENMLNDMITSNNNDGQFIKFAFVDPAAMAAAGGMPPGGAPGMMPPPPPGMMPGMMPPGMPPIPPDMANMPLDPALMQQLGISEEDMQNAEESKAKDEHRDKMIAQLNERIKTLENAINVVTKKLDTLMDILESATGGEASTKQASLKNTKKKSTNKRKSYSDIINSLLNTEED